MMKSGLTIAIATGDESKIAWNLDSEWAGYLCWIRPGFPYPPACFDATFPIPLPPENYNKKHVVYATYLNISTTLSPGTQEQA